MYSGCDYPYKFCVLFGIAISTSSFNFIQLLFFLPYGGFSPVLSHILTKCVLIVVMEDEILISIRKQYCNLSANHRKHYLCRLKSQEAFDLLVGNNDVNPGIVGNQVSITYSNLFDEDCATIKPAASNKLNTILVQGVTGVGKTTLCMSVLEDWATGKLFQEFHLVLFLPLRLIASTCSLLELLSVLYPDFDSKTCAKVATYLEENVKHNILIVTDGWEDLELSQRQEDSFFHSLLFSNTIIPMTSVTVLITTVLPSCIQIRTLKLIDRFVTLKGFNKMAIETIIHSEFEGDVRKIRFLLAQMSNNQLLERICRTPLTLAILCDHCRSSSDAEPLPNTMTKLYAKLVWTVATANISHTSAPQTLSLSKYDDLPERLKRPWQLLCELAFRNVEKGNDVLSQSNALKFMSSELKKLSYFGLIKPVSKSGDILYFSFLHPYFEKYLASLHLVSQSHKVQLTLIHRLSVSNIFWHFFISNYSDNIMVKSMNSDIIVEVIKIMSVAYGSNRGSYFVELCHLSVEAMNSAVNDQVIKAMYAADKKTLKFGHCCSVCDCEAMIYVIENVMKKCEIEINFQDCCITPQHITSLANALGGKSSIVQVKGLNLSGNRLNGSLVIDFFSRAAAAFKHLRILVLRKCEIGTSCCDIKAIIGALTESSCETLIHLDISLNPISLSFLQALQCHIKSNATFDTLEILSLKGSFKSDISMTFLVSFSDTLASRCTYLRQLDLSDNNLGEPGNPDLRKMISRLLSLGRDFNLCLNDKYMTEVNNEFISVMEEAIKNKGTINHTIAHGVIVGPGRSGKNTLMSRLMGNKPPDPNEISPSTGVLENIVKIEVKKISTVATAVSNLEWMKLEHDEEALELIMTTTRSHSAVTKLSKPTALKYIVKESEKNVMVTKDTYPSTSLATSRQWGLKQHFNKLKPKIFTEKIVDKDEGIEASSKAIVYRSDAEPVDIFKRAMKLRGMDALREHLESSWSLYLTNTGGQIEFQEHLPLLVCGPSIFFVTFPLHHDLMKPYDVRYEYADGRVKEYKSPGTLLEELLQTLATIDASNFTSGQQRNSKIQKPKIFFVGTHKDFLSSETTEETIQKKDELLQKYIRQTSVYKGSIQFAEAPKRLIFTVNNFSPDDEDFHKIRSAVQQTVEKTGFTIECPSSWLVLSLILRAKHKSDQVLTFEKCFSIAQECGIIDHDELKQALSFIHSRLGLIRYFNTDDVNNLVIIDPQILFDRITDLTVATFTANNVEVNQIEDFQVRGIIPLAVMQEISDKDHCDSQLPFIWLINLLNYLRIAALFADSDGNINYFFPSALCHAPEQLLCSDRSCSTLWPRLLIGFKSGFCPRGIPGALIKYLMTNEMKSSIRWTIISNRIFRNQVSFAIQACEIITLKIFPTHLELSCETEEQGGSIQSEDSTENVLIKKTGKVACEQIRKGMITVTSQCNECNWFWGFNCTVTMCEVQHPAEVEWDENDGPFKVVCNIMNKRGNLPNHYEIWSLQNNPNPGID
jgi:GTPase SAR1 family protein